VGIWDQLNTKTIADNASTEIQVQSNPVHLQESNRAELQDIKLINDATMRNGSPIVGTMVMQETTVTDNTGTAMLTCPKGQVLQVINYGYKITGLTGSGTFTAFMGPAGDEGVSEQGGIRILYYSSTSATPVINSDADYRALSPLIIDENFQLGFTLGGSYTSATVRAFAIRIR
jgi:hypothetical protein